MEAAAIPMVGLTSWQALKLRAQLKYGQKVLIPAGAGGIGTFAIQLAKQLGARVGTTTSAGNVDLLRGLGADEVIDYKKQEFEAVLRDYDAVLGTIRGDGIVKSLWILKPGSPVISLIGPPDVAFARARGVNALMQFVFGLLSRKIISIARTRGAQYVGQINADERAGMATFDAVVEATGQRARPVVLTALAAVPAFVPLTFSAFRGSMAYTLVGGTIGGTVSTPATTNAN